MGEENVSDEEARELWAMMKDEFTDVMNMSPEDMEREEMMEKLENFDPSSHTVEKHLEMFGDGEVDKLLSGAYDDPSPYSSEKYLEMVGDDKKAQSLSLEPKPTEVQSKEREDFSKMIEDLKNDWKDQGLDTDEDETESTGVLAQSAGRTNTPDIPTRPTSTSERNGLQQELATASKSQSNVFTVDPEAYQSSINSGMEEEEEESRDVSATSSEKTFVDSPIFTDNVEIVDQNDEDAQNPRLAELRKLLPAFSDQRLKRILHVFTRNLGNPTLIELVPIVRENMPDYITNTWLKKMSALTANYVVQKAAEEHLVDRHILNGVLEIEASHGSLDRALDFHQREFKRHDIQPTGYSDRLVLQMFLKNNRLSRALAFKQKVDASGRTLDLKAYGSLVDYCSRRKQVGSAMLLLKECISVHGAPPGEAMLKELRMLCRQKNLTEKFGLTELIGDDPVQWFREGKIMRKARDKRTLRVAQEARAFMTKL